MRYAEKDGRAVAVPGSKRVWLQALEGCRQRYDGWPLVARTEVGNIIISTIFLIAGPPDSLGRYETTVLGGPDGLLEHHCCRRDALAYHDGLVEGLSDEHTYNVCSRGVGIWSHHETLEEALAEHRHMQNMTGESALVTRGTAVWDFVEQRWRYPVYDEVLDFTYFV